MEEEPRAVVKFIFIAIEFSGWGVCDWHHDDALSSTSVYTRSQINYFQAVPIGIKSSI